MLQIRLLGEVQIQIDGKDIEGLPSRAAEALLIYLACHNSSISREKLSELLWANRSLAQSLTNLRTILSALRREMGNYLNIKREVLSFNREEQHFLDVIEFENQLNNLGIPNQVAHPIDLQTLEKLRFTLDLYRGDFLEGFYLRDGLGFEEWSSHQRERLKQLALSGYRLMTLACLDHGFYADGLNAASNWLRLDPYNEEATHAQMWLYLRTGQKASALLSYQALKRKLKEDLDTIPTYKTTDLYRRFQNIEVPAEIRLPTFSTKLIGRNSEIAELETHLISQTSHLITIVGPGGIGKTRLAAEAATILVNKYPGRFLHGIHFVSLEALTSAYEIPARIAESISFSFHGMESPAKQLLERLKDDERLLILDNFEHLLDSASGSGVQFLVEVLRYAPNVKILITSRERINMYEEIVFDLHGLDTTNQNASSHVSDAIQMFLQNAKRVSRNFPPNGDELKYIGSICRLIEGTPLAIEMASTWVRNYDCKKIASLIAADLDFLKSPYVNAPQKHQSLRLVFDRSWSLLKPEEQIAFAKLAVFHGSFTFEAACFVVDSLSIVSALIDKSLIQKQMDERLSIHPLLYQFVNEKLSVQPDSRNSALTRHTIFYLEFLSQLGSGESSENRTLIRADWDNITVCYKRAAQSGMVEELENTVGVLHGFFSVESWFHEGIELFNKIIEIVRQSDDNHAGLLCELHSRKARMHTQIGQIELARSDLEKALEFLDYFSNLEQRSRVLDSLAITNYYAGDYGRAAELAQESLHISQKINNADGIAFSLNFLGSCAKARGDYLSCRDYFERSVSAYREIKDEIGAGMVLNNLGNLLQAQGFYMEAQNYYVEAGNILKSQNHIHGAATTLVNAGKLAIKQGQKEYARQLLEEGLEMKRRINDQRGEAIAMGALSDIAIAENDEKKGTILVIGALRLTVALGDTQLLLDLLVIVALLKIHQGDMELAKKILSYVVRHNSTIDESRQHARQLLEGINGLDFVNEEKWDGEMFVEDMVNEVLQEH